jgi:alpha-methylacyl-CoA racemase
MGPLEGVRIVEFAGLGPAPFGAMMLADFGAEIIWVDRPGGYPAPDPNLDFEQFGKFAFYNRNRGTVRLDLKAAKGRETALRLITSADALIEPFRPGVMEKLGLGSTECLAPIPPRIFSAPLQLPATNHRASWFGSNATKRWKGCRDRGTPPAS